MHIAFEMPIGLHFLLPHTGNLVFRPYGSGAPEAHVLTGPGGPSFDVTEDGRVIVHEGSELRLIPREVVQLDARPPFSVPLWGARAGVAGCEGGCGCYDHNGIATGSCSSGPFKPPLLPWVCKIGRSPCRDRV